MAEFATPEQISIYAPKARAVAAGTRVFVEYRLEGQTTWEEVHELLNADLGVSTYVTPSHPQVENFSGVIFHLTPGRTYQVRLTCIEPGQPISSVAFTAVTRALPPAAGAPTHHAKPGDNINAILDSLKPGDVLQLANGVYAAERFTTRNPGGAEGRLVYVRGASRDGVILQTTGGSRVYQGVGMSHAVFENMSMDCGTTHRYARCIEFHNSAVHRNVTFRGMRFAGRMVIDSASANHGILVYDCVSTGSNRSWETTVTTSAGWDDHAVRLAGTGNCVWNCDFSRHGDTVHRVNGVFTASNFAQRNKVRECMDDFVEFDYCNRNCGFYRNDGANMATALSMDYVGPGPFYYFENQAVNVTRGPLKLNSHMGGLLAYNNTIVRRFNANQAGTGGMYCSGGGSVHRNWAYRNNVFVYYGAGTRKTLELDSRAHNPIDFDHNAWFPDGGFEFEDSTTHASLAAVQANGPATTPVFGTATRRCQDDLLVPAQPFVLGVTLTDDTRPVAINHRLTLAPGSPARNSGVHIPGITNGYSGAAPDRGAVISGKAPFFVGCPDLRPTSSQPPAREGYPAWRDGMVAGEWRELPAANWQTVGPWSMLNAWNGFARLGRRIYATGIGGHWDGHDNGSRELDLDQSAPAWGLLSAGTPASGAAPNVSYYADGRPTSAHTYYAMFGDAMRNKIFRVGTAAAYGNGNFGDGNVNSWDVVRKDWDPKGTWPACPASNLVGASMCQDPVTGDIYVINGQMFRFAHATATWSSLAALPEAKADATYYRGSCYDTLRNRVLALGDAYRPTATGLIWDKAANTWTRITYSGDAREIQAVCGARGNAVHHDPALDRYLVKTASGGQVFQVHPTTFAVSVLPTTGAVLPSFENGVWQRFVHVPSLNGYLAVPSGRSSAYFLATG